MFSVGVLLALPLLTAAGDPQEASPITVAPVSVRWWLVMVGLVAQGVLLAWAAGAPRLALLAVATIAFGLSFATPGVAHGITSVAVLVLVFRAVVAVPLV